jgi:hypothetical protein
VTCFNPWPRGEYQPKPERGARVMEREADDKKREKALREFSAGVKKRDTKCRWPEAHECRFQIEAAHVKDKSLCGPNTLENGIALCGWLHRRGPQSIHGKQIKVERDTPDGVPPLFSFWRQTGTFDALGQPVYHLIAREVAPFLYERD